MFKKKSLKFTYEKVSRDIRHAETLKARESSRFKRLSMIRSINDSDCKEKSMEIPKENKCEVPEKRPSRLEMLFKWKQEKQIKKEMEKLSKKKPFYSGGSKIAIESKPLQSFKSSFTTQSNSSSFNTSKLAKSKLVTPNITTKPSRILNPKQGIPSSTIQSKAPNVKQGLPTSTFQSSRIPNSKQGTPATTYQSSKIPNSKQVPLPKTGSNLSRSNSTATLLRKFPTSTNDKTSSKPGSSLTRSNSSASVSRKIPNPSATEKQTVPSKAVKPLLKRVLNKCTNSANTLKPKDVSKPATKGPSEAKIPLKRQEEKPVKKVGIGLPKVTSNVTAVSKGIPIQNKLPVSSMDKKFGSNLKLNQKDSPQPKDNSSLRKGYCFRTAVSNSIHQRAGTLLKTPLQGTPKKQQEKPSKNVEEKLSTKEFSEPSLENFPDVTFNSDISIIKPTRPSFAPASFTFQPPEGLNNFIFDDDDCDIYQTLEEMKLKFMSRTSTPSKSSGRTSSIKSSKESLENNDLMASVEKSDISNSRDINISELMTPVSFKLDINDEKSNEALNKEMCPEVACDIIANINVKEAYQMDYDKMTSVSPIETAVIDVDVIKDQENEKIASISPIVSPVKEDNIIENQDNEGVNSISLINVVVGEPDSIASQELASVSPLKIIAKEACIIANQKNELSSDSPIKTEKNNVPFNQEPYENFVISLPNDDIEVGKIVNQQISEEIASDLKAGIAEKNIINELQEGKEFDCSNKTENPNGNSSKVINNDVQLTYSFKNGASENTSKDIDFFDNDDSLIDSIDLDKIKLMKLDDEDSDEDDFPSPQVLKCAEGKSNGAVAKRVSMLKHLSVMNSIAETVETDEGHSVNSANSTKDNKSSKNTPQRSKRISNLISLDMLNESPLKNSGDSPNFTPRRSLRLKNVSAAVDNCSISPFKENNTSKIRTRQSVRLIDLNTPEKAVCEKLLGGNLENLDPNKFLIDFESPTTPTLSKSKKVSLLYSPEKRKSIRKSIRGDLMSFSPS